MVRGHALQTADRNGLVFDAAAATRGLARPIADATENAWENVGFAIDEIGFGEASLSDEANVLGYIRMRGAGPLTIDDAMVIVRISGIGRFHRYVSPSPWVPFIDDTSAGNQCRKPIPITAIRKPEDSWGNVERTTREARRAHA